MGAATRRFSEDGDPKLMLPKHPHSPNHRAEKNTNQASTSSKGKERELPAVFDTDGEESSSSEEDGRTSPSPAQKKVVSNGRSGGGKLKRKMSVGGIQRELEAVKQAHAQKEAVWEDNGAGDTTVVRDERQEYLERIMGLEAEVQRLKAEVC